MDVFIVDPWDGTLFKTPEVEELERQLWENARRLGKDAHIPEFQVGPWSDDKPWPTSDDIETLVRNSQDNEDFWSFITANDTRDEKHSDLQRHRDWVREGGTKRKKRGPAERAWYREVYNYYYVMLAIAAAKDMTQVNSWLLKFGQRKISRELLDAALTEFYDGKTGPDSQDKSAAPTFGALMQAYRRHLKDHMPRNILGLDVHRTAQITPFGWTATCFPDADAVIDDFITRIADVPKHKSFSPQLAEENRPFFILPTQAQMTGQQPLTPNTAPSSQGVLLGGPLQPQQSSLANEDVHIIRFNDGGGQPQAYLMMNIYYRVLGWMDPQDRTEDEFKQIQSRIEQQITQHNQGCSDLEIISKI